MAPWSALRRALGMGSRLHLACARTAGCHDGLLMAGQPAFDASRQHAPAQRSGRRRSLLWRLSGIDGAALFAAAVVLALGPVTISSPVQTGELVVIVAGFATTMVVSLVLLRRTLQPLETLKDTMRRIDPLSPGRRVDVAGADADVAELALAFNEMLDRLELERRESGRMALSVQEAERRRGARELHDEGGQTLTAMLLQIEGLAADVPEAQRREFDELRETARIGAEDVRRIARRLRPEALEELGLQAALLTLVGIFSDQSELRIDHRIARPHELSVEQELVIYRVAQEALTNIIRHAAARHAELSLTADDHAVVLQIADDGRGIGDDEMESSYGIRGMRERALLIGATLSIDSARGQGTRVTLRVPRTR